MTDAELNAVLPPTREMVKQLHAALVSGAEPADPGVALRSILGEDGAYAAKLHRIFSEVHRSKAAMRLRAPHPVQRRAGDERGFQALGPMLGTKLEAEQETAAKESLSSAKRQRLPTVTVEGHSKLAGAAEAYFRERLSSLLPPYS
mmetsp:Transcript_20462/g.51959  ORF Transcript_20462/g.51959 Transcript_20462/m.51959 type:complete len:146 (-) Transcript_20462:103-540(-)|eukprot:CAMPEP_0179839670 /NCGR_PEP_ID=MMETSP0982-20121206/1458_1 /TAXON_ID=483367 /ORGANISM="non described non described, Strain CCMP 2436" /LENGTH=145 /DNA_ID=CAMNT_0021723373 /DNA_START=805 /DNA_END=1242 /DNA_ORIENTATION=+